MRERRRGVGVGAGAVGVWVRARRVYGRLWVCALFSRRCTSAQVAETQPAGLPGLWPFFLLGSWSWELLECLLGGSPRTTGGTGQAQRAARSAAVSQSTPEDSENPEARNAVFFSSPEDGVAGASCKKRRAGVGSK
jgi:hypothetical protein